MVSQTHEITNEDRKKLVQLVDNLEEFKHKILSIDYTHDIEAYFTEMQAFRKFVATYRDEKISELFLHSGRYDSYKKFFRSQNFYYIRSLESYEAVNIMAQDIKRTNVGDFGNYLDKDFIYQRYLNKSKEFNTLNIDDYEGKTIVMVGSGPLPDTVIYISQNTQIGSIVGLDNNEEAIFMGNEMIRNLGLQNVTLRHISAEDYNYKDADLVYITAFVTNRKKIFKRINDTSQDHIKIIAKEPLYLEKMLYEDVSSTIHPRLKMVTSMKRENPYKAENVYIIEKYDF